MIDNGNAPRHHDIVADYETSIADQIAPSNEGTASYANFATSFLEAYVGMNNRFLTDRQTISRDAPNPPPGNRRSTADRNRSRGSAAPAKSGIN
jgi:hypothetical protein